MVKFSEEEMKCAYKEVYYIIEFLDEDIKEMIPNEKIEFYKSHMDNTHSFRYDLDKDLNDQNILYPTKCILSNLFKTYIATEEDKAEIEKEEQKQLNEIENEKHLKYNPDNIFKTEESKPKLAISSIEIEDISTDMIVSEKEEPIFRKIINKILKFLKIE